MYFINPFLISLTIPIVLLAITIALWDYNSPKFHPIFTDVEPLALYVLVVLPLVLLYYPISYISDRYAAYILIFHQ